MPLRSALEKSRARQLRLTVVDAFLIGSKGLPGYLFRIAPSRMTALDQVGSDHRTCSQVRCLQSSEGDTPKSLSELSKRPY